MPLPDARDPLSKQNATPGNPGIRNPFGGLMLPPTGMGNYGGGMSSMDYSGQASQAYNRAKQTLADAEQKKNSRYPIGFARPGALPDRPVDETLGNNNTGGGTEDFGRGDRQNEQAPLNGDGTPNPAYTGQMVDGFGNPVGGPTPPSPKPGMFQSSTGTPQQTENAGTLSGAVTPGGGGGGTVSGGFSARDAEDPEMRQQLLEVMNILKQQGMGDLEAQKAALDWYQKQHAQTDQLDASGRDWANAILGKGQYAGKSFDPDNPAAFSGIAAEVNGITGDMDQRLKQLEESNLDPATKMRMREEIINQAYANKGGVRLNNQKAAHDFEERLANRGAQTQQAPQTGGAGTAGGLANSRNSMLLSADLQGRGQDIQREQFGSELEYRRAKDAADLLYRQGRDTVGDAQSDRDYQLRKMLAEAQAKGGEDQLALHPRWASGED